MFNCVHYSYFYSHSKPQEAQNALLFYRTSSKRIFICLQNVLFSGCAEKYYLNIRKIAKYYLILWLFWHLIIIPLPLTKPSFGNGILI